MGSRSAAVDTLAAQLRHAERSREPIAPLTEQAPSLTLDEAYAIQSLNVETRLSDGASIVGRKVGLTSRAMQQQLGVSEPDFGVLMDHMVVEEGDDVVLEELLQPRVEAEIAFVMAEDLRGPGVTAVDALRAVAGAVPALEIIDSRIADWRIGLIDTVADNASSGRFVVGGRLTPLESLDLGAEGMAMFHNGDVVATGAGAAVLGNPLRCVSWLANTLAGYGDQLHADDVVLAGALHAAQSIGSGDVVRAEFAHLGAVTARFVEN